MDFSNERLQIVTNQADKVAEIDITGMIGGGFFMDGIDADELRAELKAIERIEAEKIVVNIDSLGGLVNHALTMHDLLAQNKAEVEVNINGMTASAATVIAMAGDKVRMSDNALFLIHRAWGGAFGHADNMAAASKDTQKVEDRLISIYAKRTGLSNDKIKTFMAADDGSGEWWSADEAKENGFVDEIFEPMKLAAQVSLDQIRNAGLPVTDKLRQKANIMDTDEKTLKQKVQAWVKETVQNLTTKKEEEPETNIEEAVQNAATKLEEQYTNEVSELTAKVEKLEADVTEWEKVSGEKDNQIEALEKEKVALNKQLEELQEGKSGAEAKKDPDVETGKPKQKTEEEKAMETLVNLVNRQRKQRQEVE